MQGLPRLNPFGECGPPMSVADFLEDVGLARRELKPTSARTFHQPVGAGHTARPSTCLKFFPARLIEKLGPPRTHPAPAAAARIQRPSFARENGIRGGGVLTALARTQHGAAASPPQHAAGRGKWVSVCSSSLHLELLAGEDTRGSNHRLRDFHPQTSQRPPD